MPPLREMLRNDVKDKLARDEVVVSMTVRLCRTPEIAQIARSVLARARRRRRTP